MCEKVQHTGIRGLVKRGFTMLGIAVALFVFMGTANAGAPEDYNVCMGLFEKKEYRLASDELQKFIKSYPKFSRLDMALFYLGECYYRQQKYREASPVFERYVGEFPTSKYCAEGMYQLGRGYFSLQEYKKAATVLQKFAKAYPDGYLTDAAGFWLAESWYQAKNLPEAIKAYGIFLSKYKKSDYRPNALYGRAWALADNGEHGKAAGDFKTLALSFPQHELAAESAYLAGEQYYAAGKALDALPVYRECARRSKDEALSVKALYAAGWILHEAKRYKEAAQEFSLVFNRFAKNTLANEARFLQGFNLYKAQQYVKAAALFGALAKNPGSVGQGKVAYWHGVVRLKQGRFVAAVEHFTVALGRDDLPKDLKPRAQFDRANALFSLKRYDRAQSSLGSFLKTFPQHELVDDVMYQGILIADAKGATKQGKFLALDMLKKFPKSPLALSVRFALAKFEFELGEYSQALASYRIFGKAAAADDKRQLITQSRIGLSLYRLGKLNDAKKVFTTAHQAFGKQTAGAESSFMLGKIAYDQKQYQQVVKSLLQFGQDHAGHELAADAQLMLGASYLELKSYDKATVLFVELAAQKVESRIVRQALLYHAEALYQAGKLEKAVVIYQDFLSKYKDSDQRDDVIHGMGIAFYNLKQYDQTIKALLPLSQLRPDGSASAYRDQSLYLIGYSHEMKSEFSSAIGFYQAVIKGKVAGEFLSQASYRVIGCLYKDKQFKACVSEATRYLTTEGGTFKAAALYDRAWAQEGLGNKAAALKDFQQFLAQHPKHDLSAEVAMKVGELLYFSREYAQAVNYYKLVLKTQTTQLFDKAWYKVGCAYDALEDKAQAKLAFNKVIKKYPQSPLCSEIHYRLGELFDAQKDYQAGLAAYDKSLQGKKAGLFYEKALLGRAEDLRLLKRSKDAMMAYQLLVQRFPKSREKSRAYCGLGLCRQQLGAYRDAIKAFKLSIDGQTGESAAKSQLGLGQSYNALKEYDDAVKSLLKVSILYAYEYLSEAALYEIALCYESKGDKSRSHEYLNSYLKQYPQGKYLAAVKKLLGQ